MFLNLSKKKSRVTSRSKGKRVKAKHAAKNRRRVNGMQGRSLGRKL